LRSGPLFIFCRGLHVFHYLEQIPPIYLQHSACVCLAMSLARWQFPLRSGPFIFSDLVMTCSRPSSRRERLGTARRQVLRRPRRRPVRKSQVVHGRLDTPLFVKKEYWTWDKYLASRRQTPLVMPQRLWRRGEQCGPARRRAAAFTGGHQRVACGATVIDLILPSVRVAGRQIGPCGTWP
jgi:hypothetical protein